MVVLCRWFCLPAESPESASVDACQAGCAALSVLCTEQAHDPYFSANDNFKKNPQKNEVVDHRTFGLEAAKSAHWPGVNCQPPCPAQVVPPLPPSMSMRAAAPRLVGTAVGEAVGEAVVAVTPKTSISKIRRMPI